ncbi:MlaE family ABC transporter permease [Pedosphaera parvula]|uniref:MlaE family ABC transporter permease n=1 Tax=Pedosphaera parvula TaxID=1032527 RepID=UPI00192AC280|nr:ABC transporter permease [Pedosphaera parvula]
MEFRSPETGKLQVVASGDWKSGEVFPDVGGVSNKLDVDESIRALSFDVSKVTSWSSGLIGLVMRCRELAMERKIAFDQSGLPQSVQRLIVLALAVPEKKDARSLQTRPGIFEKIGLGVLGLRRSGEETLKFIGDCTIAFLALAKRKARYRWTEVWLIMQQCGPDALPIVALINFLVGAILAFVGAVQLSKFGAAIYVADLVGIATMREMGVIMMAVIMCGRTGAAFAAQLGTMKVNQEIDAYKTLGISPIEFLVMPRIMCLWLMFPVLCIFADLMAIVGGGVVALAMLNFSFAEYWQETVAAVTLTHFFIGIVKSFVFGVLVAMTSCLRGIQCGNDAAAVGLATTSAVVTGITVIVIADAIFAVILNVFGI